ncbi:hypothetical protein F5877DRAFT_92576 [Lentinula edodes]|nr:hypothetical protein F5877DRAFT_92576 [Lentinula edodes]
MEKDLCKQALAAGHWSFSSPAKAFNGVPFSCSFLSLLLIANFTDEDQYQPLRLEEYLLELGDESILVSERMEEALKKIESSNLDILNFALAYYAYAVTAVVHVQNHIPFLATLRANIPRVPTG